MIFQYTLDKVLLGKKTQTRRLIKGINLVVCEDGTPMATDSPYWNWNSPPIEVVTTAKGYSLYEVNKVYSVTPGRGKPTVYWRYSDMTGIGYEILQQAFSPELLNWGWKPLRIRITGIQREDVRNISQEDAIAEGFQTPPDFLETWIKMHDKSFLDTFHYANDKGYLKEYGLYERSAARYDAWALTFEVAR